MTTDSCKVMVVDDNRDVADSSVMLLRSWGHEAIAVYSGEECVAKAKDFDPDVIIMDIGLPGHDGFEVKERVEKICPNVRVVALTGYTQGKTGRGDGARGVAGLGCAADIILVGIFKVLVYPDQADGIYVGGNSGGYCQGINRIAL